MPVEASARWACVARTGLPSWYQTLLLVEPGQSITSYIPRHTFLQVWHRRLASELSCISMLDRSDHDGEVSCGDVVDDLNCCSSLVVSALENSNRLFDIFFQ